MAKLKRSFLRKVQSCDQFGHSFQLNFNNNGNVQTTLVGGFGGMLINMMILAYTIVRLKAVFMYEDNSLFSNESKFNNNDLNFKDGRDYRTFDGARYSKGMYWLVFESNGKTLRKKVILN